jgi:hypothetical protein
MEHQLKTKQSLIELENQKELRHLEVELKKEVTKELEPKLLS